MLKVIIADDEPKVNLLLQKIVDWEKLGYQIAGTANDGERALQLIEEEKPDVLMTDIRMPEWMEWSSSGGQRNCGRIWFLSW